MPQTTFDLTPNLRMVKRVIRKINLGDQYNENYHGKDKNKFDKSQKFIVLKNFLILPVKAK